MLKRLEASDFYAPLFQYLLHFSIVEPDFIKRTDIDIKGDVFRTRPKQNVRGSIQRLRGVVNDFFSKGDGRHQPIIIFINVDQENKSANRLVMFAPKAGAFLESFWSAGRSETGSARLAKRAAIVYNVPLFYRDSENNFFFRHRDINENASPQDITNKAPSLTPRS